MGETCIEIIQQKIFWFSFNFQDKLQSFNKSDNVE